MVRTGPPSFRTRSPVYERLTPMMSRGKRAETLALTVDVLVIGDLGKWSPCAMRLRRMIMRAIALQTTSGRQRMVNA